MSLWTIFATGLFTGGITCLAVQGGLLAATIAQREGFNLQDNTFRPRSGQAEGHAVPILIFLVTKLAAYTVLGMLLGLFGSLFQFSLTATVILQLSVGIFMLGTALTVLDVHPIFRYFIIQPPCYLTRMIRKESKSAAFFTPAILGAFTIFLPCGTTQAMMALAISSGSPVKGALILFAFILGTSPLFFILGYFATRLGDIFQKWFLKLAALVVIFLAILNINTAIALSGSRVTLDSMLNDFNCTVFDNCGTVTAAGAYQAPVSEATITISSGGYTPDKLRVKAGSNVTIHLVNQGGGGCASSFTIPKLAIRKAVPVGESADITFTAPNQPTTITFMCSMNMYRGEINVI